MIPMGAVSPPSSGAGSKNTWLLRGLLFVVLLTLCLTTFATFTLRLESGDEFAARLSRSSSLLRTGGSPEARDSLSDRLLRKAETLDRSLDTAMTRLAMSQISSEGELQLDKVLGDKAVLADPTSGAHLFAKRASQAFMARYWLQDKASWPVDPLPRTDKFVSFEPWHGGFNNIRMSLEMAAAFAFATKRTLVLPPRYNMYLRGHSSFQDYFDYEDLRRGIPCISYEEFREIMQFANYEREYPKSDSNSAKYAALREMKGGDVMILSEKSQGGLIGSQIVYCFPNCPKSDANPHLLEQYQRVSHHLKGLDANVPELTNARVIHFAANLLGHFYTFVWFKDDVEEGVRMRKFIRDHIHFTEEIFSWADKILDALGGAHSFDCLHVRRNDFQFKEVWTPAEDIVKNLGSLIGGMDPATNKLRTVYIATDEIGSGMKGSKEKVSFDPSAMARVAAHPWFKPMFEAWGGPTKVKFWSDYHEPLGLGKIPKHLIGSVESVVCSRARRFAGTQKSTFTGYIHRLRGYMLDVGSKELYEAQAAFPTDYYRNLNHKPSWGAFPHGAFGGGHPYWGREYKEAWEGAFDPV